MLKSQKIKLKSRSILFVLKIEEIYILETIFLETFARYKSFENGKIMKINQLRPFGRLAKFT